MFNQSINIQNQRSKRTQLFGCLKWFLYFTTALYLGGCATQSKFEDTPLNNVEYASLAKLQFDPFKSQFSYGNNLNHKIYHWSASSDQPKQGSLFIIHGGCWLSQFDMAHTSALSSALAKEGFDVWNIEYRRAGNGGEWPLALDDILKAINFVIDNNPNINLSKTALVGHSAGGHLAMLAAANYQDLGLQSQLKVLGLAPIIDIQAYSQGKNSCQTATPLFMQGTLDDKRKEYEQASPLSYEYDSELTYAMIGGKDIIVEPEFASHPDAQQFVVTEAGHFDWIHPQTAAFEQLLFVLKTESSEK